MVWCSRSVREVIGMGWWSYVWLTWPGNPGPVEVGMAEWAP